MAMGNHLLRYLQLSQSMQDLLWFNKDIICRLIGLNSKISICICVYICICICICLAAEEELCRPGAPRRSDPSKKISSPYLVSAVPPFLSICISCILYLYILPICISCILYLYILPICIFCIFYLLFFVAQVSF